MNGTTHRTGANAPKEFEMGERTSNKQLADKLDTLIDLMIAGAQPKAATDTIIESPTTEGGKVKVDPDYMAHMTAKAADHATTKGSEVVLYARRNKAGETKLAYALRERYDDVVSGQPSCLGAVGSFKP